MLGEARLAPTITIEIHLYRRCVLEWKEINGLNHDGKSQKQSEAASLIKTQNHVWDGIDCSDALYLLPTSSEVYREI